MENKVYKTLDDVIGELNYKVLSDVLCMAIEGIRYWGTTDYDDDAYKKAKQHLIELGEKRPSWEEVLGQMLLDGGKIHIIDIEDGEDSEYTKDLTIENLKHGIQLYILNPRYHSSKSCDWTDIDAWDGDVIIQFALFDEIIFG